MNYGLIVAAGSGKRFGARKQFALLRGKPLFYYSLRAFELCPAVKEIALVTNCDMVDRVDKMTWHWRFRKLKWIVPGGAQRPNSVWRGLSVLPDQGMVAIHDGVRPILSPARIARGFRECRKRHAVIYALPVAETVKRVAGDVVMDTVPRENLVLIQTPQFYDLELIKRAYGRVPDLTATDDAQLVEALNEDVAVIPGWRENIKVTTREDLELAGRFL